MEVVGSFGTKRDVVSGHGPARFAYFCPVESPERALDWAS